MESTRPSTRMLILLHWLTLLLVLVAYLAGELREFAPRGSDARALALALHMSAGLTVLLLLLPRLLLRSLTRLPPVNPPLPRWQARAAAATHALLYLWMAAMPLTGWLLRNAEGAEARAWGWVLPALVQASAPLAERLEELHEALATFGYLLVGLHATAALLHHLMRGDDTLRRMRPLAR